MRQILDYAMFLTRRAKLRKPSPIRELQKVIARHPDIISLGGGMPNPETFPYAGMALTLRNGNTMQFSPAELQKSLQYSPSRGIPEFVDILQQLQVHYHGLDASPSLMVTTGSQDGLSKAFDCILERDDVVLVESPTYAGALTALQSTEATIVEVAMDSDGILPNVLEETLMQLKSQNKRVKCLYTIPTGQNPSGISTSLARKQAIYALCAEHACLILEDDPYYFLTFANNGPPIPSYLSMDTAGLVLRFDSLSKVLSSGIRIGWVTGPEALINALELSQQATALHTCGIAQVMCSTLLQQWKIPGFQAHVTQVAALYAQRCQWMDTAIRTHCPSTLEWVLPTAGMFIWLRLPLPEGVDSAQIVYEDMVAAGVLMVPGGAFFPEQHGPTSYVRLSFSTASKEAMETAMQRLGDSLRQMK